MSASSTPKRRKGLSVLTRVSINSPCNVPLERMTDTPKGKFCSGCRKHVWDSTLMTKNEMRVLLAYSRSPCLRLTWNDRGDIQYKDSGSPALGFRCEQFLTVPIAAAIAFGAAGEVLASPDERGLSASSALTSQPQIPQAATVPSQHMRYEDDPSLAPHDDPPSLRSSAGNGQEQGQPAPIGLGSPASYSRVAYGGGRLDSSESVIFTYIEGAFGALALAVSMLGSCFTGVLGALLSNRSLKRVSFIFLVIGIALYVVRIAIPIIFYDSGLSG
jgi:hypothetical protein